ncbi:2OG-Fe(II) oxygenase [Marinicellulosiphila megalodicopiae]|uniref:2OG-Fe(II) oxygenase n=1 Tax=Marinicellulosiphila megalodicopiae TaxID=2724896 RepID=UPI003BAE16C7
MTFTSSYEKLFNLIIDDLVEQSYSLQINQAPQKICEALLEQAKLNVAEFQAASVGRKSNQILDTNIRSDKTLWIEGHSKAEIEWLAWCEQLKIALNQSLYLGLNNFECHYSIYNPNDFYQKHVDAFKGKSNRKVSMVLYLNKGWQPEHEGQLVIYPKEQDPLKFDPTFASFVVFLSEDIPHEVLASHKDRFAIACWFRVD